MFCRCAAACVDSLWHVFCFVLARNKLKPRLRNLSKISDRDRWGAFEHRKVACLARERARRRRRFWTLLAAGCVTAFVVPFAAAHFIELTGIRTTAGGVADNDRSLTVQVSGNLSEKGVFEVCSGGARRARKVTCLVDGDTGWERGVKWRLMNVDTPELNSPACAAEYRKAVAALNRLRQLMVSGYKIVWTGGSGSYGRQVVRIYLLNGRDAGEVLLSEGLAQPWPNLGNVWCD